MYSNIMKKNNNYFYFYRGEWWPKRRIIEEEGEMIDDVIEMSIDEVRFYLDKYELKSKPMEEILLDYFLNEIANFWAIT